MSSCKATNFHKRLNFAIFADQAQTSKFYHRSLQAHFLDIPTPACRQGMNFAKIHVTAKFCELIASRLNRFSIFYDWNIFDKYEFLSTIFFKNLF